MRARSQALGARAHGLIGAIASGLGRAAGRVSVGVLALLLAAAVGVPSAAAAATAYDALVPSDSGITTIDTGTNAASTFTSLGAVGALTIAPDASTGYAVHGSDVVQLLLSASGPTVENTIPGAGRRLPAPVEPLLGLRRDHAERRHRVLR